MINLNRDFCGKLKEARRKAKLSQSELAAEVGCNQSALSMFESGDPTKLNDEVVGKLAKKFNLSLTPVAGADEVAVQAPVSVPRAAGSGFCPNRHCPTNRAFEVEELTLYLPDRAMADPVGGRFCAMCGEVLERRCPSCGATVHAGAICSHCGEPYVR